MGKDELFSSALVGAGGAALWWWKQDADDRDNRIRTNQLDVRDLSRSFDLLVGGSDWIRLQAPTMRDHIIGIAAATPESQPSETVPPLVASVQRPDLSGGANIPGLAWPPSIGTYDSTGKTRAPGELAPAAYVSTFQEPCAWAQGLTQSRPPSPTALLQLFYAAQGLSAAAGAQNLSPPQWVNLWTQLFGGVIPAPAPGPAPTPALDPHQDPTKQPTGTVVLALSIVASGNDTYPANPYRNPQTDAAQRWHIACAAAGHNAGDRLAHITFKTEYFTRIGTQTVSFQPIVLTNRPGQVYADNITSNGFDLIANIALPGSQQLDVFVAVQPGVVTL